MKKKYLIIIWLFSVVGTGGCRENSSDKDEDITPCNNITRSEKVIEIKDLQTALYFITSYPQDAIKPSVPFNQEGIVYNLSTNTARFSIDSEGQINIYAICNFPVYAINWNPKNWTGQNYDIIVEGKVDIIVNGTIHLDSESAKENSILVLTSLKKK
jgi:hypothetical protein